MKLATVSYKGDQIVALVNDENNKVFPLRAASKKIQYKVPETMQECIAMGEDFIKLVNQIKELISLGDYEEFYLHFEEVEWLAPIPRPQKNIFCVGKNYAEHAIELGSEADIPEHIMLFSKAPTTVIGHGQPIPSHQGVTDSLDYEGELAVIIGKKGKGIKKEEALDYIFGYTIINDVTGRDLQERHIQYLLGKSLDGSCPMGPFIVHRTAIRNPENLHIETKVNEEVRQRSNTSNFIFKLDEIISEISKGMTLEPGDIIATGTPAGVGKGFKPPKYLKSGDQVEITIEGIGTLKNIID